MFPACLGEGVGSDRGDEVGGGLVAPADFAVLVGELDEGLDILAEAAVGPGIGGLQNALELGGVNEDHSGGCVGGLQGACKGGAGGAIYDGTGDDGGGHHNGTTTEDSQVNSSLGWGRGMSDLYNIKSGWFWL